MEFLRVFWLKGNLELMDVNETELSVSNSMEKMKLFYEVFPYPDQSQFRYPKPQDHPLNRLEILFGPISKFHEAAKIEVNRKMGNGTSKVLKEFYRSNPPCLKSGINKILIVGCGTDEPLMYRIINPSAQLLCVDLSLKSIEIAKSKLIAHASRLSLFRFLLLHFPIFLRKWAYQEALKNVTFLEGDAAQILRESKTNLHDLIVCTGVLHHQPVPSLLFGAMCQALKPNGILKLMVYTHTGRRLERGIQRKFGFIWDSLKSSKGFKSRIKLTFSFYAVLFWLSYRKYLLGGRKIADRFKYTTYSKHGVADAFLHPSDPGMCLENLIKWSKENDLVLIHCQARGPEGWTFGCDDKASTVFSQFLDWEKCCQLQSNVWLHFKKKER